MPQLAEPRGHAHPATAGGADAKTDPVRGMKVDPATAVAKVVRGEETYYFCSTGCRAKFDADPDKFLKKAAAFRRNTLLHAPAIPSPPGVAQNQRAELGET